MKRNARDHDVGLKEQRALDQQRPLVVEQMVPPFCGHELRQHDREVVVWTVRRRPARCIRGTAPSATDTAIPAPRAARLGPTAPIPGAADRWPPDRRSRRPHAHRVRASLAYSIASTTAAMHAADRDENGVVRRGGLAAHSSATALRPRCRSDVCVARKKSTCTGISSRMIHAPSCDFVMATTIRTIPVTQRAETVDRGARLPSWPAQAPPVDHHAGLRQREGDEDANHVERYQRVGVAAVTRSAECRRNAQPDDAVREREAVALIHELSRDITVACEDGRQPGKVRVRRIRREHEDEHRRGLHEVVRHAAVRRRRRGRSATRSSLARSASPDMRARAA